MLTRLTINNVAVIEHAEIDFAAGFNVLTGETGAGKSIIIDSINSILGERMSREIVRSGKDKASVYAEFTEIQPSVCEKLNENDIEIDSDTVILQRIITSEGKSSARVNGFPVPASFLREIGNELITVCGQHDSQKLLQKTSHLGYIDSLAGTGETLYLYRKQYQKYKEILNRLESLRMDEDEKRRRLDFLKYQLDEIEAADIKIGEKDSLTAKKKLIKNREKIINALNNVTAIVSGGEESGGIIDILYDLSDILGDLSEYNPEFEAYRKAADEFRFEIEECSSEARNELMNFEYQDVSLDEIESRLDIIYRIGRKYGDTEEDILKKYDELKEEYDSIQMSDRLISDLRVKLDASRDEMMKTAKELSNLRKAAAKRFENDVISELEYLDMKGSEFRVEFAEIDPSASGIDSVEFFISPNRGQELKPLGKIASGGELSRVMLAIRCILSESETVDTTIFDEIDSGVSGVAAGKIALKLRQLSRYKQVICVTHLPQIAASADNHFFINKLSDEERTYTEISTLKGADRAHEIARIISGDNITESVLQSAEEMINIYTERK